MNRNVKNIRPGRLNIPKVFLLLIAIVIIVLGIYTIKTIIGPNYDSKYSEMFNAGEIINPAIEYVGVFSSGVLDFVKTEITSSKFLDFGQGEVSDVPQMENPLGDYETEGEVGGDGETTPSDMVEDAVDTDTLGDATEEPVEGEEEEETEVEKVVVKDEDKKDIIKYILILIKAYNLHNPPFSSNTPKIELNFDGEIFNAEIITGEIYIDEGPIEGKDIIIYSNWNEAIVMSKGLDETRQSFSSGGTLIEQICADSVCFLKGYKEVYDEISA